MNHLEVDGIISIPRGFAVDLKMFTLKDAHIDDSTEAVPLFDQPMVSDDENLRLLKMWHEEWSDLEWDPTLTF